MNFGCLILNVERLVVNNFRVLACLRLIMKNEKCILTCLYDDNGEWCLFFKKRISNYIWEFLHFLFCVCVCLHGLFKVYFKCPTLCFSCCLLLPFRNKKKLLVLACIANRESKNMISWIWSFLFKMSTLWFIINATICISLNMFHVLISLTGRRVVFSTFFCLKMIVGWLRKLWKFQRVYFSFKVSIWTYALD